MEAEQDTDLWIIALSGTNTYLGCASDYITKKELLEAFDVGDSIKMDSVSVISVTMMPTPQGLARNVAAYPFVNTLSGAPVYLHLSVIQFLDEMQDHDRAGYKQMAERAEAMATQIRAQASGISIAGGLPQNGPGQPGT